MQTVTADSHVGKESTGDDFSFEIYQGNNNNCAVHAQFHVLKEYGFTGSVDDLVEKSFANGWTSENGTMLQDVGKLLESNGIPCTQIEGANEYRLFAELAQGKQVIVAVDSGELWYGETRDNDAEADHALTVIGMDTSDPNNVQVIVTDSGTGHEAKAYPVEEFMDAWRDSNCFMVVPDEPPPAEMDIERLSNFNFELGHVEQFGDLSFSSLIELQVSEEEVSLELGFAVEVNEDDPFADLDAILGGSSSETSEAPEEPVAENESFDNIFDDIDFLTNTENSEQTAAEDEIGSVNADGSGWFESDDENLTDLNGEDQELVQDSTDEFDFNNDILENASLEDLEDI